MVLIIKKGIGHAHFIECILYYCTPVYKVLVVNTKSQLADALRKGLHKSVLLGRDTKISIYFFYIIVQEHECVGNDLTWFS